ncbi:MAG: YqaJ viral recombinase family nuclease [Ruminiclostridium sp.]
MFKILTSTECLSTEEWLEFRKFGIGGSDSSVVCGINRYKSPIELWMEKTGQWPNQEAGEAAYWGHCLESLVRDEFTRRTGIVVTLVKQILQSEEHPFMLANLDGICEHPDYGTCVFEAKTASTYKSGEWNDAIPDEYILQVQHYLAVTGYKGAFIAVLIGGNQFKWKFIERDEELIAMLIQLEIDFWDHVKSNVPPSLDGSDASVKFLSERFPDSVPQSRLELPQAAVPLIEQYNLACEEVDKHTEKKQEAENLLKQMLGENEAGMVKDTVVTWKTFTQERLDSKTLKSEHPKLFKKYANKTSYRRFSIKQAAI